MNDHNPLYERSVQSTYLDEHGREIPNPIPMQPPVGYVKHKSIAEIVREQIALASMEARMAGAESEEEANDFDVGEDMEPHSQWEHDFDPDPAMEVMIARQSSPPVPAPAEPVPQAPAAPAPTAQPSAPSGTPSQ